MVFWIAILAGALFVWLAVRMGFYETWALLFNVLISIYVAIFLAPRLAPVLPASPHRMALTLIVLAGGCFILLHGVCYVFLTGQFSVQFPRFFELVLGGALGFVTGFLIISFLALAITTSPVAQRGALGRLGFDRQTQRLNLAGLAWSCQPIHVLAGREDGAQAAIERILQAVDETIPSEPLERGGNDEPGAPQPEPSSMMQEVVP